MSISAAALDSEIKQAFNAYNNGAYKDEAKTPQHLKILGDTMKDYFEKNTKITYTWAAVLSPPASTPDPVASFNSTVKFPAFDLTAAKDLITLALLIQTAILGGIINHAAGFAVPPGSFLMKSPLVFPMTKIADTAIETCICVPVCAWVLTLTNPAPLPGSHAAFIGATAGMVIA